ncbi:MAG TPA: hypothetical protein PLE77_09050 [Kiritimatiellia bacterium]|nr:hypothetical protein [Kiritimatiellia bacterium]
MKDLPRQPFTTEDFSPRGGGIDFLGLRWVGLTMVGNDLLPQINNATSDMGMFFLGAWIPWKFQQLCQKDHDRLFTEKNYRAFREKVEIAISLTFKDEYKGKRPYGVANNRIGVGESGDLPYQPSFKTAGRTNSTSLYAAAIYGPALRALGLMEGYRSQAVDGSSLDIAVVSKDEGATDIVKQVDASLQKAKSYDYLDSLDVPKLEWSEVCKLGEAGLDPTCYRGSSFDKQKARFLSKLLPTDPEQFGYARTVTARLLLATLAQRQGVDSYQIRDAWYTGLWEDGKALRFKEPLLENHCRRWSCFMARQYQRYAIELFLWCFEEALAKGCRSIEASVEFWAEKMQAAGQNPKTTFKDLLKHVAGDLHGTDEEKTSRAWNAKVHVGDKRFEYVDDPCTDKGAVSGLRMLAGWYWRMIVRRSDERNKTEMELGGADRMGMGWFFDWLRARQDRKLSDLLRDIFSDLIFSQHMRVALSRFDGSAQRLRFLLGDQGVEPTVSARRDLAQRGVPWMPDRLNTLVSLLRDCDILEIKDSVIRLGPKAAKVSTP